MLSLNNLKKSVSPRRIFTSLPLFALQNQFSSHDHLTDYQVSVECASVDEFSDFIGKNDVGSYYVFVESVFSLYKVIDLHFVFCLLG